MMGWVRNFICRVAEKAQHLGALTVLVEDRNLVFGTHTRWFTTTCNSSSKGLTISSGLLRHPYTHMCTTVHTHTHIQKEKKKNLKKGSSIMTEKGFVVV